MSLLLIGFRGQLGQELERKAVAEKMKVNLCDIDELDISDPFQVERAFSDCKPNLVINAAAYTAVDRAETEPEPAYAINRDGPKYLAQNCGRFKIPLIHVSTDYVFDGTSNIPYRESDPVSPMGIYGKSKAEGEKAIMNALKRHIIIRTSWLYGFFGNNFVKTMLRLGMEKESIRVVNDQTGCPTCASDLADAILIISRALKNGLQDHWGIYHYCGKGHTTWHDFARRIFAEARRHGYPRAPRVVPVPTSQYPTPVKRPSFSVLDCSKIEKQFNVKRPFWQDSLEKTLKQLLDTKFLGTQ